MLPIKFKLLVTIIIPDRCDCNNCVIFVNYNSFPNSEKMCLYQLRTFVSYNSLPNISFSIRAMNEMAMCDIILAKEKYPSQAK